MPPSPIMIRRPFPWLAVSPWSAGVAKRRRPENIPRTGTTACRSLGCRDSLVIDLCVQKPPASPSRQDPDQCMYPSSSASVASVADKSGFSVCSHRLMRSASASHLKVARVVCATAQRFSAIGGASCVRLVLRASDLPCARFALCACGGGCASQAHTGVRQGYRVWPPRGLYPLLRVCVVLYATLVASCAPLPGTPCAYLRAFMTRTTHLTVVTNRAYGSTRAVGIICVGNEIVFDALGQATCGADFVSDGPCEGGALHMTGFAMNLPTWGVDPTWSVRSVWPRWLNLFVADRITICIAYRLCCGDSVA